MDFQPIVLVSSKALKPFLASNVVKVPLAACGKTGCGIPALLPTPNAIISRSSARNEIPDLLML